MNANLSVNFKNRSRIDLAIVNTYIYLENTFDPTGINDDSPITEGAYDTSQFEFGYTSTNRTKFRFNSEISFGGYFSGEKFSISNNFNFRIDKLLQASLKLSYDKINLPEPQKSVGLILVSSKLDFTFTKNIFGPVLSSFRIFQIHWVLILDFSGVLLLYQTYFWYILTIQIILKTV